MSAQVVILVVSSFNLLLNAQPEILSFSFWCPHHKRFGTEVPSSAGESHQKEKDSVSERLKED